MIWWFRQNQQAVSHGHNLASTIGSSGVDRLKPPPSAVNFEHKTIKLNSKMSANSTSTVLLRSNGYADKSNSITSNSIACTGKVSTVLKKADNTRVISPTSASISKGRPPVPMETQSNDDALLTSAIDQKLTTMMMSNATGGLPKNFKLRRPLSCTEACKKLEKTCLNEATRDGSDGSATALNKVYLVSDN